MVNPSKSSEPFNKEIHISPNSACKFDTSKSVDVLTTNTTMAPNNVYTEDRNILVCGARGCGKTSLIFTISRGIFPGSFSPDITPGRFEGWSLSACAIPMSASSNKSSGSTNISPNHAGKEKIKPYNVNLTFWEDRPRLNLDLESSDSSASDSEETSGNDPGKFINPNLDRGN